MTDKVRITQVKSPIARPDIQERTLVGARSQQAAPQPRIGRHAGDPR